MTNAQQWNPQQKRKSIPRARIERWVGKENADRMSAQMAGWYGQPINIRDLPGSVWIDKNGEYVGEFSRGEYFSAADAFDTFHRKARKLVRVFDRALTPADFGLYTGVGFSSISDALSRASGGNRQLLNGGAIQKTGATGVVASCNSLWRVNGMPGAGAAGSAAPGGRAPTKATTGAMAFRNPSAGTLHLTGADFSASIINNAVMLYDRIFDVAKTMNSAASESVTGVPTRYQSTTATDADYAGGNFLFVETGGTALAATAHNWASCTYRNQAGTDTQALPTLAGISGCIADRFDMPVNTWSAPLAAGDTGVMDLANIQCSASVATGAVNFVIGHPIAVLMFPVANSMLPYDWLTNRDQAPRIFDDAALSMFEFPKPTTSATNYAGMLYATNASA